MKRWIAVGLLVALCAAEVLAQVGRVSPHPRDIYSRRGPRAVAVYDGGTGARDSIRARRNLGVPGRFQGELIYGRWIFQQATVRDSLLVYDDTFVVVDGADSSRRVVFAVQSPADSVVTLWTPSGSGELALTSSIVTDHGGLSGLSDDDHTQYAALSQNESVTGQWTFRSSAGTPVTLDDSQFASLVLSVAHDGSGETFGVRGNGTVVLNPLTSAGPADSLIARGNANVWWLPDSTGTIALAEHTATSGHSHAAGDHGALTGLSDDDHPQYFALTQNETASGDVNFTGDIDFVPGASTDTPIGITANASQSVNLVQIDDSSGNGKLEVDDNGVLEIADKLIVWEGDIDALGGFNATLNTDNLTANRAFTLPDFADGPLTARQVVVDLSGQTANVGATNATGDAGYYRVGGYVQTTSAGSGTLLIQLVYTDDVGATTQTIGTRPLGSTGQSRIASTTVKLTSGNLQYQTGGYSAGTFSLFLTFERVH